MIGPIFRYEFTATPDVVDANGHVNNVAYIQWMQYAAIRHAEASGCTPIATSLGATWVVRTHHVEYLRPAFAGQEIRVLTWIANFRKVQSLRKYEFIRAEDYAILVKAETDWVFVDAKTGRPRRIPDRIKDAFQIVAEDGI